MNKLMGIVLVAGLALVVGCEEKKAPTKTPADAVKGAADGAKDAAKGAVDGAKDAGKAAVDGVKEKAAEGAAALRDKAVEVLKPQVDAAKTKLDELVKKADGLDAVKKTAATPLVDAAKKAFADLTAKFDGLKSAGDGWDKAKEAVEAALKGFNDSAAKLGDLVK